MNSPELAEVDMPETCSQCGKKAQSMSIAERYSKHRPGSLLLLRH